MSEPLITRPLRESLHMALGRGYWECRPVPKDYALTAHAITKNKAESGFYIQFQSEDGEELDEPILWQWPFWVIAHEHTLRNRARSERLRNERFVFEANVKKVRVALNIMLGIEGDMAHVTARMMVQKGMNQQIKALGVNKLYKSIEEI